MNKGITIWEIIALIVLLILIAYKFYDCGRTKALTTMICQPGNVVHVDLEDELVICKMSDGKMEVRKY